DRRLQEAAGRQQGAKRRAHERAVLRGELRLRAGAQSAGRRGVRRTWVAPSRCLSALQRLAVPLREVRSRGVCFLKEAEQQRIGIGGLPQGIVRQNELTDIGVVKRAGSRQPRVTVTGWLRISIDKKRGAAVTAVARPESAARHFVRIGFRYHRIGN